MGGVFSGGSAIASGLVGTDDISVEFVAESQSVDRPQEYFLFTISCANTNAAGVCSVSQSKPSSILLVLNDGYGQVGGAHSQSTRARHCLHS